ncbi:hypothetical protein ACM01_28650 [Streptomyces viridochromogenes]|uniref:Uncharacterized protein n=1 Tax=Streptomyces viridochromogenes TaxID=1938 RepID=A0A0J7Z7F1_STRVR|nr:RIP homotypic interaction motif-containing protein [Streptomyces viridochromogenes]KMS71093.1 hypothetical protein ACM01_28650 [Streptomyces viridochromogenes]KOG08380.1 hypothetical protein ADK36_42925 [Streptomyces viridochromogenes]KOG28698.1 hypothetical protein ADK35_03325 [Streptomyces viridochromogenes]
MNGVDLVVAALAAGAAAGLTDTTSSAIRDAYAGLRESVRGRLATGSEDGVRILEASEAEPTMWQDRLGELLSVAGVDQDEEILASARSLLQDMDGVDPQGGPRFVDAREAKGVQIGSHNTQTNTFN